MYILENNNKLSSAVKRSFSDLKLTERKHLQEWIAAEPSALGEDLLIIQKEFDGFSETKERLDLLALDKQGRLVIIENKLDDSGKDVTWQAIKYASYCSSLSKQEILDIYSKYVGDRERTIANILDFYDIEDIDEVELNVGDNTQRIFFVAANFRKEVTSSVLWLSKFGLEIKCFKVTPFTYNNNILIDFDQIIPIKDAEEYTIKMAAKTQEATQVSATVAGRFTARRKFWAAFIELNSEKNGPYASSSPSTDNWIGKSLGVSGLTVNVIINYSVCRVELYFNFGDKDTNKTKFDFLYSIKDEIQSAMPEFPLVWERLNDKVTCRVKTQKDISYLDEAVVPEVMNFLLSGSCKFLEVFSKYNKQIAKSINMTGIRIPSHNPEDWFLGVIKFFDSRKDFGYIASNNCGMCLATYEQDFWVNSDCFTDSSAKVEGALVVFQWEHQSGGKRRAKNVRRFSKSVEDDCKLAVKYCGTHEVVQLKERQVNMVGLCGLPRKYLLPQLKVSIITDENRNIETTLEIFKQFIGKYKTVLPPNNWRYVFSKDFDSELKSEWIQIFTILTDEEWIAVLNAYPPAVIYANDITIDNWLKQFTPRFADSTARDDFKYTLKLLNEVQKAVYAEKWRIAAEEDFLQKLTSYKQKGEIPRSIIGPFDELKKARILLAKFSDNQFESEIQDCLDSIKATKFRSALEEFSKNQDSYHRQSLLKSFKNLYSPSMFISEFIEVIDPIIQNKIETDNLTGVFSLLNYASEFSKDYPKSYLHSLQTNVEDSLHEALVDSLSNDGAYCFENTFENKFSLFTSLYDEDFVSFLKEKFVQTLKESKSVEILLYAADSIHKWISNDNAISLCSNIINLWSFDDIDNIIQSDYERDKIDKRLAPIIFSHAIELISRCKISKPFNEIVSENTDENKTIDKNTFFLIRLSKLNKTEVTKNVWSQYLSTLYPEALLIFYDKGLIESLPQEIVMQVVNGLTLQDTFNTPNGWYSVPAFQNKSIEKILSNPTADIFSPIAKILVSATIDKDNIGLYIWLTELLAFNKPEDMDYYETREWDNNFSQKLTTLRSSVPDDSPLIAVLWAVYMQTRSSQAGLAKFFSWFPPYLQIKVVKRLFSFVAQGKLKHSAKSMYNFLSSNGEPLSLAVEIAFSYLIMRENDPSQNFNNSHMLQLIDGRSDHSEWIGIREFVEQCHGRWGIEYDENIKVWDNKFYNGRLLKVKNSTDLCLFIPNKMVNKSGEIQNYNNKFAKTIADIIALNFDESAYKVQRMAEGTKYFFNESSRIEVYYLIRGFNIYCPFSEETLVYSVDENYEDYFCECRVAYQLSNREGLPFYWCGNKPCFRPWVRFHTDEEWQKYTMLDFMRILNIPVDYTNLVGKTTKHGYFIIFSSFLKSFAKFYEHLKCRKCRTLLHPVNITNFATQAVTEFTCTHDGCEMNGASIYLNHCFNRTKCKSIIDSRDSKQCPNGQYICPECGGCCSTENFRNRISNLVMTGGFVSPWLENFVKSSLGHWERGEYFCYSCGAKMEIDDADGIMKCPKCGTTYNEHK